MASRAGVQPFAIDRDERIGNHSATVEDAYGIGIDLLNFRQFKRHAGKTFHYRGNDFHFRSVKPPVAPYHSPSTQPLNGIARRG